MKPPFRDTTFKIDGHDTGTHEPSETHKMYGGIGYIFKFSNEYGASVVRHRGSYGNESGSWEIAVLGKDGELNYDTPITDDVLGNVKAANILGILDRISKL